MKSCRMVKIIKGGTHMKNTIYDYVDLRGDLSPIDFPYNEIDFLIFSELSYINLDEIIQLDYEHIITIHDAFLAYNDFYKNTNMPLNPTIRESYTLFEKMAKSYRYQNIQMISFVNDIDKELIKQFSAMTLILENQDMVVVYRGTDDSLVGWHEDFLMLCENVVPAQLSSVEYLKYISDFSYSYSLLDSLKNKYLAPSFFQRLKKHFQYKKQRPIYLTGHSKGGNLAMYAGCFIDSEIQKRIIQIYNYDGPGFQDEIMLSSEYKNMLPIIQSYIPHYSFFGIVLGHEENYHVVHSHYTGMLQHNGFSWEVGPYHFVEDELSCESVNFAIKVLLFLEKLSNEDKHLFVDSMFKLFDTLNLYTFSDLSHISYKHILGAIKELTLLDSKVRKMLIEVLHMLWLEAKKTKPE